MKLCKFRHQKNKNYYKMWNFLASYQLSLICSNKEIEFYTKCKQKCKQNVNKNHFISLKDTQLVLLDFKLAIFTNKQTNNN